MDNPYIAAKQIIHQAETSLGLLVVSVMGGLQLIYNNFLDPYKNILDKYKIGEGNGIKWVINIEKESVELVKIFLDQKNRGIFLTLVYYVTVPKEWIGKEVSVKTK